ncbi:unnamed protein product, partial [Mesorhabditis spiculigera]
METIRALFGYPDSMYNCSGRTSAEWLARGEKWPILGNFFIMMGVLYILLYLPSIYSMIKLKLLKNPCYRIMFCLIFADIMNLTANSLFAGYIFAIGGGPDFGVFWDIFAGRLVQAFPP